jgi:hypothetical protein
MTPLKLVSSIAIATAVLAAGAPASAACIPSKVASTFGSSTTAYWIPATSVGTAGLQAWQLGAFGTFNSTGCPSGALFPDGPGFSLNFDLGSCGAGCPGPLNANTLAVLAENKLAGGTEFLLDTIVEEASAFKNYDYGTQGNHTMIAVPRPRVLSSSYVPNVPCVQLHLQFDSVAAGLFGPNAPSAVNGFKLLYADAVSDPGNDPAAYSVIASVDSPGGAQTTTDICVPCSLPNTDEWLATQIVLENGSALTDSAGTRLRIQCQSLADPKPRAVPRKIGPPTSVPD